MYLLHIVSILLFVLPYTNAQSECAAVTECYLGGVRTNLCKISSKKCAICLVNGDECYGYDKGVCPFSGIDCSAVFSAGGASTTSPPTTPPPTTLPPPSTGSSSSEANDSKSDTNSSAKSDSSSIGVYFIIFGAAIGVLAVAFIFLTLVRRSKEENSEEDEVELGSVPYPNLNSTVNAMRVASTVKPTTDYYSSGASGASGGGAPPSTTTSSYYSHQSSSSGGPLAPQSSSYYSHQSSSNVGSGGVSAADYYKQGPALPATNYYSNQPMVAVPVATQTSTLSTPAPPSGDTYPDLPQQNERRESVEF